MNRECDGLQMDSVLAGITSCPDELPQSCPTQTDRQGLRSQGDGTRWNIIHILWSSGLWPFPHAHSTLPTNSIRWVPNSLQLASKLTKLNLTSTLIGPDMRGRGYYCLLAAGQWLGRYRKVVMIKQIKHTFSLGRLPRKTQNNKKNQTQKQLFHVWLLGVCNRYREPAHCTGLREIIHTPWFIPHPEFKMD